MRKTKMGQKCTGQKTRINPISKKRQMRLPEELEIRRRLCQRAGGFFVSDGVIHRCIGGVCEKCKQPPDWRGLHPHHTGIGASRKPLSLKDKMLCGRCHALCHGLREV